MLNAIGWITGGNATRLAATLAIGLALGSTSAWRVQTWRHTANAAAQAAVDSAAREAQAKEQLRAHDKGLAHAQATDQLYQDKIYALQKTHRNRAAADSRRNLERVLDAGPQCPAPSTPVPAGQAPGRFDATDARWHVERGGDSP